MRLRSWSVRVLREVVVGAGVVRGGKGCAVAKVDTGARGGAGADIGGGPCEDGFVNMLGHCAVNIDCGG